MPPPFKQIDRDQFAALLEKFGFERRINAVHMHHTWRPNHSQYDESNGHRTIVGMFLHHTQVNGWRDIAQHITIAPDGSIWLGRNWNLPPVSASGHNGNSHAGPFMFEIIGDFDTGRDLLEGEQRKTVIDVIARVQRRFGLAPETLRFHNAMSSKSCPGTGVTYEQVLEEVQAALANLDQPRATPRGARRAPFAVDATETSQIIEESIEALTRELPAGADSEPADAEPTYDEHSERDPPQTPSTRSFTFTRDSGLTAQKLAELRPHLVNLNLGRFSKDGEWKTEAGDVDAIFGLHLERALEEAKQDGIPLRILFFAHGGLVKESAGLEGAHKRLELFRRNGIYPIYFVWETGLFETIGQLLRRAQTGTRGFVSDKITDPLIETLARALGGPTVWGGMKLAAERAVADKNSIHGEGGARYVAEKLKAFCAQHSDAAIELHAVAHSAGSIFHAHFLAAARKLGVPSFKTVQFLAPAVRVDIFKALLGNLIGPGKGVDRLTLFTMSKDFERDDHCAQIYRKSLLYLVHHALEPEKNTPILGLEQSLREDAVLVNLLGLASAKSSSAGDVVFAVSPLKSGRSASTATRHGDFDEDPATLGSAIRRVLDKKDADGIFEYAITRGAREIDPWADQVDWPEEAVLPAQIFPAPAAPSPLLRMSGSGRRKALCIGINQYISAPLKGCVADATDWAQTFTALGFETRTVFDEQATRSGILAAMNELIASSAAGDVLVLQYAGHGTQLQDLNGDDEDGKDEALCPIDHESGAYLIDDDIRSLFASIPEGVNLTCFFDCCHSGSNTRFAAPTAAMGAEGRDRRRRFIPASSEMQAAHKRFRAGLPESQAAPPVDHSVLRNVSFAACQDHEVAYETNGHGDFTQIALAVFKNGVSGLTNEEFQRRVIDGFGSQAMQEPRLDCTDAAFTLPFLQPLTTVAIAGATSGRGNAEAIALLEAAITRLRST